MTIEEQVMQAKKNNEALEQFLLSYTPYIKKQVADASFYAIEYEDRISIAMLVFVNCVKQYEEGKGGFLSFLAISIRNRLIDEVRQVQKHRGKIIEFPKESEREDMPEEHGQAVQEYRKAQEQEDLREEIAELEEELADYDIRFRDIPTICPKQKRARLQCKEIAETVYQDMELRRGFLDKKRLPQAELAVRCGISVKTIEKHRKYIILIFLILNRPYLSIKTFLPESEVAE